MEERPPSRPRVAWEERGAPQERRPPPEPYEVTEVQPLHADADWLPANEEEENEEEENEEEDKEIIEDFLRRTDEEMRKVTFLKSICTICRKRKKRGLSESLAVLSREKNVVAKVKKLLENEPTDQLCTAVRYQAMLAIAALSEVRAIAEDEIRPLLNACFKAIFHLPPRENLNIFLYDQTLHAMDNMLQMLLVSHRTSFSEEPWNILEVLLRFTSTQNKSVCERAMERISKLISFITSSHWQEPFGIFFQPSQRTDIVRMTLEIIGDSGTEDEEWANFMLGVFLRDPATWLMDVSSLRLDCRALPGPPQLLGIQSRFKPA
ncbi:uncharacterized protein LOC110391893 [Numida meleagris]|uniref:uncharacterized protein LOC110391893 n=1 Tax=Numida meleagris TaxID=8996 RepID=UPI000B3E28B1|nr:uncharacterized protein LOC110391893 [Numida meleagris]